MMSWYSMVQSPSEKKKKSDSFDLYLYPHVTGFFHVLHLLHRYIPIESHRNPSPPRIHEVQLQLQYHDGQSSCEDLPEAHSTIAH